MNSNTTETKLFTTLDGLPLVDVSAWDTADNLPIANRAELDKMLRLKETNRYNDIVIKCQQYEQLDDEVPPTLVPTEKDAEKDHFLADLKLMEIRMLGSQEISTPIAQATSIALLEDVFGEEAPATSVIGNRREPANALDRTRAELLSKKENKDKTVPKLKLRQQQQQEQPQAKPKAKANNLRQHEQKQNVKRQYTFDVDKLKGTRRQSATDMRSSAGTSMPPALVSNLRTNSLVNRKPIRSMSTISSIANQSDMNLDDIVKQIGNLFVKLQSSKQRGVGGATSNRGRQSTTAPEAHSEQKSTSYVVTVHKPGTKSPRCVIHAMSATTMQALETATTSPTATAAATIAAVSTAACSFDGDDHDLVYVNKRGSDAVAALVDDLEPMDLGVTLPQPRMNGGIPSITIFSPSVRGQNNHFNAAAFTQAETVASARQLGATKSDTNLTHATKSISYLKMPRSYCYTKPPK